MTTIPPPDAATTRDEETGRLVRRPARDRVLGLSGVGFAVVLLSVLLVPHASLDLAPGSMPSDPDTVTAFFDAHYVTQQAQAVGHSLAGVLLLVFLVALAEHVRRAARTDADVVAARLTLTAGAAMAAVMLLTMALVSGSVSLTGDVDGAVQGWMYALGWWAHPKFLYLLPVALVPACAVLRRAGAAPSAVTWTGQAIGVLGLLAMLGALSATIEFVMYPVLMLLILWVFVTGVVSLTRGLDVRVAGRR